MELRTGDVYTSFIFISKNPDIQWSINGSLSADLIAGICTSLFHINKKLDVSISILNNNPKYNINIKIGSDSQMHRLLSRYIFKRNLLPAQAIIQTIPNDYYAWGIYNPNSKCSVNSCDSYYDLYIFKNNDFIRGFITICDYFSNDFRDLSLGFPFKTTPNGNVFYSIEGYDIDSVIQEIREPAPTGAYYTFGYEQYDRNGETPLIVTDEVQGDYPRDFE